MTQRTQMSRSILGFTLSEVMLGFLLISLTAFAVLGLLLSARAADRAGMENVRASYLGRTELAKIKSRPYAQLLSEITSPFPAYSVVDQGQSYLVTSSVKRLSNDSTLPEYELLDVKVELAWKQKKSLDINDTSKLSVQQAQTKLEMHSVIGPASAL